MEWIVLIIGIICIVISFLLVERKDDIKEQEDELPEKNHIGEDYELNEEELAILQSKVRDKIMEDANEVIYDAEQSLSTVTNEKMMALGDYAVTVCDEIEKNHKEVMFLYSMLNDKEQEIKRLMAETQEQIKELKQASELAVEAYVQGETFEETEILEEDAELQEPIEEDTSGNINDIILQMNKNGMSIMKIARELGLGVGEVKLVVDLFKGEKS